MTLFRIVSIMFLVACLTGVASDIYTPSLAFMAEDLNCSIEAVQWTLAIFMLGVALSQLVYGPVSDGVGRRPPMLMGLGIMLIGSVAAFLSPSIEILLLSRFIQGLGAGACATLWRSIFRDVFPPAQMAQFGAYLGVGLVFVVAAAPTVGGYLQDVLGWRASFAALFCYAALNIITIFFLFKETSKHHHPDRLNLAFCLQSYKELMASPIFMGYSLCVFLTYGAYFAWVVVGPVLLIEELGVTSLEFGWMNLIIGAGGMISAIICHSFLVKKYGSPAMLRVGWTIMICAATLLMIGTLFFPLSPLLILTPMFFFLFGATFIWPNAFVGAFMPFGHIAGYAGALYSFMQLGGGAFIGWLCSFLPTHSPLALSIVLIVLPGFCLFFFHWIQCSYLNKQEPTL